MSKKHFSLTVRRYSLVLKFSVAHLKGASLAQVARGEAQLEPFHALGRGSVIETLRHGISSCLFLQVIVTYHERTIDGFFYVAIFERSKTLVVMISPYSGVEIGQQFKPNTEFIGLCLAQALHLAMHLVERTQQIFHVVPHFVGNHVSVGKIATCS